VSGHIVRSVVELARSCGLHLVTEGVETEQQAADLHELGVQFAQGYLFGHPVPVEELCQPQGSALSKATQK
jgi:EAL domain-containing protein (putative c-di-GMP-specific phosphodiesterase class I)